MIKDVVVALAVGRPRDVVADYAVSLAAACDAHVTGIAFAYEPVIPGTVMTGYPYDFLEANRAENRTAADAAAARLSEAARRAGVASESRTVEATVVGAADLFGRMARRFDLSVVGQGEGESRSGQERFIEAALFQSGRPVIVVPFIQSAGAIFDRVLLGWDGSQTAARAVGDALPLLARAKEVEIVIVTTDHTKRENITGTGLARHLAHHDLKVDVKTIAPGDLDVANTILSYAADSSADFIVMGGYGHSRLREFVLGGATRGILESLTVPVLMAH